MKIALWLGMCGLCAATGHAILGVIGFVLLLGCCTASPGTAHTHARKLAGRISGRE
ncbi:hypothetical protein [Amycolatopsis sp. NPDC059657]|uniref:hypothetical protein n=1 Tax=Amycolatopsis sp. NPDC059657 TaxID=3346899 RepID=UPI00366F6922